jgi:CheY-like chemotaxis protein
VLVVDDNRDAADSLALLVEYWGHQVTAVYDAKAALQAALRVCPHVVLLDLMMPGIDGLQVAACLAGQPKLQDTVFVAVTGCTDETTQRRAHVTGIHHYFFKPVDPHLMQALLAKLAAGLELSVVG